MKRRFFTIFALAAVFCSCASKKVAVLESALPQKQKFALEDHTLVVFPEMAILIETEAGSAWYLALWQGGKVEKHAAVYAPKEYGEYTLLSVLPGKMEKYRDAYAVVLSHDARRFVNANGEMFSCPKTLEEIDWKKNATPVLKVVVKVDENECKRLIDWWFDKFYQVIKETEISDSMLFKTLQGAEFPGYYGKAVLSGMELIERLMTLEHDLTKRFFLCLEDVRLFSKDHPKREEIIKEARQLQKRLSEVRKALETVKDFAF